MRNNSIYIVMIFDRIKLHMLFYYSSSNFTLSHTIAYVQGEWLRITFFAAPTITEFIFMEIARKAQKGFYSILLMLHKKKREHKKEILKFR